MIARGIRNNNPLNIRKGNNWQGEKHPQTDKEFEQFESMTMGIRAGLKLMRNYINGFNGKRRKLNTIAKIVSAWAPPSENATARYIHTVAERAGIGPYEVIYPGDRNRICDIAQAMMWVECGQEISMDTILSAWDLI